MAVADRHGEVHFGGLLRRIKLRSLSMAYVNGFRRFAVDVFIGNLLKISSKAFRHVCIGYSLSSTFGFILAFIITREIYSYCVHVLGDVFYFSMNTVIYIAFADYIRYMTRY